MFVSNSFIKNVCNYLFPPVEKKRKRVEEDLQPVDAEQNMSMAIIFEIISFLPASDLVNVSRANKWFKANISVENQDLLNSLDPRTLFPSLRVIDQKDWKENIDMEKWGLRFGEKQAPLDKKIFEELKKFSALPVEDDAGITMIKLPNKTSSEDFTLNKLIEGIQSLELSDDIKFFAYIADTVIAQLGDDPIDMNGTLLLTNNVLEGSRNLSFEDQKQMVEAHGCEVSTIPESLLQAFFSARGGVRLFPAEPRMTLTRCSDVIEIWGNTYSTIVGGFHSNGLRVGSYSLVGDICGVTARRKF